ncbi:MAG: tetratricopeptide repeat protein [Gaiellaceae bacterium]|jgi:tetratricopeptide (TPR) repeat protein
MFFIRLRRGAKWIFVLLVFAFAFGFLFQGVGGGGGGDIISQLLGMRGGNPITSAEQKVKQHPRDTIAWQQLAVLYDGKNREADAIRAYNAMLKLHPKDTSGLSGLSQIWGKVAGERWSAYATAQADLTSVAGPLGQSSNPLDKWVGQDPLLTPYITSLTTTANSAYTAFLNAARSWETVSRRYLNAIPASSAIMRAPAELQLAEAAANAGDTKTAIKSYQSYLRLAPKSPYAAQIRKLLAQLQKSGANG